MTTARRGSARPSESRLPLPAAPQSIREAREHVREQLRSWGRCSVEESAVLCVSELASNAVIHAGTPLTVTLRLHGHSVWVGVTDRSAVPPLPAYGVAREPNVEAVSGRGLLLVEAFSVRWGVEFTDRGKTVWCVLREAAVRDGARQPGSSQPLVTGEAPPCPAGTVRIHLSSMPVHAAIASGVHVDNVVREIQLMELGQPGFGPRDRIRRLRELLERSQPGRMAGRAAAIEAAAAGLTRFDLDQRLPLDAVVAIAEVNELLADVSSTIGDPSLASSAEVRALRTWIEAEVVRQLDGGSSPPCGLPD